MPNIFGTILNIGINDEIANEITQNYPNNLWIYEIYRKFIILYSEIIMGLDREIFKNIIFEYKNQIRKDENKNVVGKIDNLNNFTLNDYKEIIKRYKKFYEETLDEKIVEDPYEQLYQCIKTFYDYYNSPKIKSYKKENKITTDSGIALVIQEMVFGNLNENSMVGNVVSRDPVTGSNILTGEYCIKAQGDELIYGNENSLEIKKLKKNIPPIFKQLEKYIKLIENHFKDMVQVEFTVEDGRLYILQSRSAQKSAVAHVKVIWDMFKEGIYDEKDVILRINLEKLSQILFNRVNISEDIDIITKGLNASPGAICGNVLLDTKEIDNWIKNNKKVILLKNELRPEDIEALKKSDGLITVHGGKTSFGAIVARSIGKPAICAASKIKINLENKTFYIGNRKFYEGDILTIDGGSGIIIKGQSALSEGIITNELLEILKLADKYNDIHIKINADSVEWVKKSLIYGVDGIGLCRIEHLFNQEIVKKLIMARSSEERLNVLNGLKPVFKDLFKQLFFLMDGKSVSIRLLDLSFYELLPEIENLQSEILILRYKLKMGEQVKKILKEKENLYSYFDEIIDKNPILGLRGCRIHFKWPEIDNIICEAIFEATAELKLEGHNPQPEIIIPLITFEEELRIIKNDIETIAKKVQKEKSCLFEYKLGALMEVPRSCLISNKIAQYVDIFAFGTNDLTSMVLGISRIDAEEKFLNKYIEKEIVKSNPFEKIDEEGSGSLIKFAMEQGRKIKPQLIVGIVGEHAGNVNSIQFISKLKPNYISCPPLQVPIIKIAVAQAKLKEIFNL